MDDDPRPPAARRAATLWIFLGLAAILLGGLAAFNALRPSASPAPPEIANDPLLVRGREIYLDRCASCHGPRGKGDGPTAKGLAGPPVGDLSDDRWKHGDAPEQVSGVIRQGVKDTQMPGWGAYVSAENIKAVSAYVYHLAGRPVPEAYRKP